MTLQDLIVELQKLPPDAIFGEGFDEAFSYRGSYNEIAFNPAQNVPAQQMLAIAKSAIGQTFTGYKGGDYTMGDYTPVNVASWGDYNGDDDALTSWRWKYMLSTIIRPTS